MSSFISIKKHVEVCKRLEQEIESLRQEIKDTVQALNDEERRGDEWKRRARVAIVAHFERWRTGIYEDLHPDALDWFKEK